MTDKEIKEYRAQLRIMTELIQETLNDEPWVIVIANTKTGTVNCLANMDEDQIAQLLAGGMESFAQGKAKLQTLDHYIKPPKTQGDA